MFSQGTTGCGSPDSQGTTGCGSPDSQGTTDCGSPKVLGCGLLPCLHFHELFSLITDFISRFNVFSNILTVLMHSQTPLQNQLMLSRVIQLSWLPNED